MLEAEAAGRFGMLQHEAGRPRRLQEQGVVLEEGVVERERFEGDGRAPHPAQTAVQMGALALDRSREAHAPPLPRTLAEGPAEGGMKPEGEGHRRAPPVLDAIGAVDPVGPELIARLEREGEGVVHERRLAGVEGEVRPTAPGPLELEGKVAREAVARHRIGDLPDAEMITRAAPHHGEEERRALGPELRRIPLVEEGNAVQAE
ncbi:MAG: hypothetical protein HC813_01815 [Planctomycetes bacterium]|nr:hypothetical protein [Planctomycetota bacterium]